MAKPHTNKKFLHGLMAAFIFCGGNKVAAMPLVRARLVPRLAPPHLPHASRGRACNLTAIYIDRSSSVIQVSRNMFHPDLAGQNTSEQAPQKGGMRHFSSAMKAHHIE